MSKNINDRFNYLGLADINKYDYKDKTTNVNISMLYMLNRSIEMFMYHNLPNTIPFYELEKRLQAKGFIIIGKINNNLYAVDGGLGGESDIYNNPTIATVSVPYFNFNATWKIGKDCIVIYNDSLHMGLFPIFAKYCTMLNENEITMILATINKRVQSLISANDDTTLASANKFITDLIDGKISAIAETKLFDSLKVNPTATANTSNIKDLIELEQYLKASLYNEIGLGANFNMKRERLTVSEIETNSDNLYPLVDNMREMRIEGIEKVNSLFGTNITVELNSSWDYRIYNGESIHNTDTEIDESEIKDETTDDNTESKDDSTNTEKEETEIKNDTGNEEK